VVLLLPVLEVAAVTVRTISLFAETEAGLGLIGGVNVLVASQLLRSVRKLTLLAVGTKSLRGEVLAERALDLRSTLL
jgi:hypothetical protein